MKYTRVPLGLVGAALSAAVWAGNPIGPALRFALSAQGLPQEGVWKGTPVLADINGDGLLDLAAHSLQGTGASVWLGDGKGRWAEASQGLQGEQTKCGGSGLAIGDINRDGRLDLAVADRCEGVFVYLGDGRGQWRMSTEGLRPARAWQPDLKKKVNFYTGAEDLAVGDVNKDGFLDLVVAASDRGGFAVYFGDGSGKNWREIKEADGLPSAEDPEPGDAQRAGWANELLLHDIDGDGHMDVVASYYNGPRVWRGDGKGRWQAYSNRLPRPIFGGLFRRIAVADILKTVIV